MYTLIKWFASYVQHRGPGLIWVQKCAIQLPLVEFLYYFLLRYIYLLRENI